VSAPLIRAWYAIAVSFVACLAIALAGVGYTNYVQGQARRHTEAERAESDRRWCALLTELDNAYATSPGPSTEVGKKVAAEIHGLRVSFGCPER
jgi:hypothetical protein